jgi:outer membrane protein assembly factor BamB
LLSAPAAFGEDWPQWRGPDRTDVSKESGLLKDWPEAGPPLVWLFKNAGIGYSGFAVVGDTLYTMGSREDVECLLALNVKDGTEKWSTKIGPRLENDWGDGPRDTPTVDGDFVYCLSAPGVVVCANRSDGSIVWQTSMKDLGGKRPNWGYTESVLVDGDKLICTPGGKEGTLAALNKKTGEVVWRSKDVTDDAHYSSVIVADCNGKRQYIQLMMAKLIGVDAGSGKLLWETDWVGKTAVIPTPIFHDGCVYITSGYGAGCKLVKLEADKAVNVVYENKNMKNHHGGVVLVGDYLYGYSDGFGWVCQDFKTGELAWNNKEKLGKGCITYADGMLYLVDEKDGYVVLIEASPEGWKEHGRFTLTPQTELRKPKGRIWTHPVISNGKLYLRDQELVFCFDVKAK